MIKSMTGYGRGERVVDGYKLVCEIRTLNNRYREISVRLPRQFSCLEDRIKKVVQNVVLRGKTDVFIALESFYDKRPPITIDKDLFIAYHDVLSELTALCKLPKNIDAAALVRLPGVIPEAVISSFGEGYKECIIKSVEDAAGQLLEMRVREGEYLQNDLLKYCKSLKELVSQIALSSSGLAVQYRDKLNERLSFLLSDINVDQARLANEVVFWADRTDVSEEITRLGSHLDQFVRALLTAANEDAIGRKLDFIVQEMNREVNTIGSKASGIDTGLLIVESKTCIEKMREQIQNVE